MPADCGEIVQLWEKNLNRKISYIKIIIKNRAQGHHQVIILS